MYSRIYGEGCAFGGVFSGGVSRNSGVGMGINSGGFGSGIAHAVKDTNEKQQANIDKVSAWFIFAPYAINGVRYRVASYESFGVLLFSHSVAGGASLGLA